MNCCLVDISAALYFCASKHRKNMSQKTIKRQTKAIHTQFARRDAYGAISMPVYNTVAYQFDDSRCSHVFKNVTDFNTEDSDVKFVMKK